MTRLGLANSRARFSWPSCRHHRPSSSSSRHSPPSMGGLRAPRGVRQPFSPIDREPIRSNLQPTTGNHLPSRCAHLGGHFAWGRSVRPGWNPPSCRSPMLILIRMSVPRKRRRNRCSSPPRSIRSSSYAVDAESTTTRATPPRKLVSRVRAMISAGTTDSQTSVSAPSRRCVRAACSATPDTSLVIDASASDRARPCRNRSRRWTASAMAMIVPTTPVAPCTAAPTQPRAPASYSSPRMKFHPRADSLSPPSFHCPANQSCPSCPR